MNTVRSHPSLRHLHLLLRILFGHHVDRRDAPRHAVVRRHSTSDSGQATTEYALVMLGAAVIALLVIAWATAGGGAGKIGNLFDRVIDAVVGKI